MTAFDLGFGLGGLDLGLGLDNLKDFNLLFSRIKPIPSILKTSFVSTITSGEAYIYAGIFGFAKGSNFLKFLIETVEASYLNIKDFNKLWIPVKSGPIFFTAMFVSVELFLTTLQ